MNEQQMREKYKGIMQFQMVLDHKELNTVIFDLISLLQLEFKEKDYQQTAEEKWNQLIEQYSNNDDESWFIRTEE
ncbi:hypothetical protein [Shimazuella kribbensis]|uniref:hypothetical protein n=1 Tax=Shimazuella kribbensis TaxID=139808 RepID=UPI00041559BE|nr:hypothetical protein [Shimazuella kribbensis]